MSLFVTSDPIGTATVARLLGVATRTVKRWAASGDLSYVSRVDGTGAYLFDRDTVIAFRDERIAVERARLDALQADEGAA